MERVSVEPTGLAAQPDRCDSDTPVIDDGCGDTGYSRYVLIGVDCVSTRIDEVEMVVQFRQVGKSPLFRISSRSAFCRSVRSL